MNIARFDCGLKALVGGYDKYDMSILRDAGGIPRNTGRRRSFARLRDAGLAVALLSSHMVACTKEREQPQLPTNTAAPSNSLRAPAYDPSAKAGKVALKSRKWGVNTGPGTMGRPLTNGNKTIAEAQAKSLNEDVNGLKRAELQKALDEKMGGLAKCFDNTDVTSVGIYFEADPAGEARGIHVRGAPEGAENCAKSIIGSLRFPQFEGNPVPIDFPISISRRVQTIQKTGSDSPSGVPTSQFVNP